MLFRFRKSLKFGYLVGLLIIFIVLVFITALFWLWALLDRHERTIGEEIGTQRDIIRNTISRVQKSLCIAPGKPIEIEQIVVKELEMSKYRTWIQDSYYGKGKLFTAVMLDSRVEMHPDCQFEFEWLARYGSPGDDINDWKEDEGYYTLVGFVKLKNSVGGTGQVSKMDAPSVEKPWIVMRSPARGDLATFRLRIPLILGFFFFLVFIVISVIAIFASVPLQRLEEALNDIYGAVANSKDTSQGVALAKLRSFEPLTSIGTGPAQTLIDSFNNMHGQLRAFLDYQSNMMTALSHDGRNMLHRLERRIRIGWQDSTEKGQALDTLREIRTMMDDTLYLLTGKGAQEQSEKLELCYMVETISETVEEELGNVTFDDNAGERLIVQAGETGLKRAIDNLVRNARIHGGSAEVSVRREGDKAIIEIADRGPGIPTRSADGSEIDVMKPFVTGDMSRSVGGSGLGLAIADEKIQEVRGQLALESREGGGTVARVILQLMDSWMNALPNDGRRLLRCLETSILRDWENPIAKEKALDTLQNIGTMMDDTLRLLTGKGTREKTDNCDLRYVAEAVAETIKVEFGSVKFRDCGAGRLIVEAEEIALIRVIDKLVRNVCFRGGSAEVSVRREADKAIIEIVDRKPGTPTGSEHGREIDMMKPFVPGDESRATSGAGLGLAIAHDNIRDLGGRLVLDSREGGGIVARVTLPILCKPSVGT